MSVFFFFKQKTAYEMRISDWSLDVCSSDLLRSPASSSPARARSPDRGDCRDRSSRAVDHPGCWRSPAPVGAPAQRLRRPSLRCGPDGCASPPVPGAIGPPPPGMVPGARTADRARDLTSVVLGPGVSIRLEIGVGRLRQTKETGGT